MGFEHMATPRNLIVANLIGLGAMWIGFLLSFLSDPNAHAFGRFLVMTGGFFAVLASLYGGLHGKKTSDAQNHGMLIWAGILLVAAVLLTFLLP